MGKVEMNVFEPIGEVNLNKSKLEFTNVLRKLQLKLEAILLKKGYQFFIIGFLLGRALILTELSPFILPFFAAVYFLRRNKAPLALIGLIGGAATLSLESATYTFAITFAFLIIFRITKKWMNHEIRSLHLYVFLITFAGSIVQSFLSANQLFLYDWMMAGAEASLSFILTFIFLQSLPFFSVSRQRHSLATEEIVCLVIVLASIMTGAIGWHIRELTVSNILSMYIILLFAYVGGTTIGSTVGVVTGLVYSLANVSSLYQISLLAFSGLLGGMLKDGKKPGVSLGLLIATLLIGMYGELSIPLTSLVLDATVAILVFVLTPKGIIKHLSKLVPGTAEHSEEQQQYLRKVRDVTAQRVEQFASVFKALSKSFSFFDQSAEEESPDKEIDFFLSNVTEKTCQMCYRKEKCWVKNFDTTYGYMKEIMQEINLDKGSIPPILSRKWDKHCMKSKKVVEYIRQEIGFYYANQKLKKQLQDSRRLVAEQLMGVSTVMSDFAKEIKRERDNHEKQEELIFESLSDFGVHVEHVEIYSLEKGNVDIDVTIPFCNGLGQCEKLIAPVISDILGENIVVCKEECSTYPNGFCHATFRSAKAYAVDTGVAYAAKGGGFVSGDSYSLIELSDGKYAVAISDGMGNGKRAYIESNETLKLLQKFLQSGIEERLAIKSVNSILALRTTDEIFSTLDLAMFDMQNAECKFLKIGSTPSFIKRGNKIIKIQASNLPMGILQEVEVDVVNVQLKPGDLIIMMSDGVFEGPKHVENYELWMKRKIGEIKTTDPQAVADILMEEVIRTSSGTIGDDMTVVVTKIEHNTPKWASIPVQKYQKRA
jgi:stage II sporulation protein E